MNETRKWVLHRISAIILAPLYIWLFFSLIVLSTKNYLEAIYFFKNPLFAILTIIVFFVAFFHAKISLSEIFEDYIHNKKNKDVANLLALILIFFWLIFLSLGENNYQSFLLIINSFIGKFILIGFTWSMSFHLLSGIRHLVWDLGYGFEIKTANITGVIVIIFSLILTIIFWLFSRGFI